MFRSCYPVPSEATELPELTKTSCPVAAGLAGTAVVLQVAVGPAVARVVALAEVAAVRGVGAEPAVKTGRLLAPGGQLGAGGTRIAGGTDTAGTGGGGGGGEGGGEAGETNPTILLTLCLASCWGRDGSGGSCPVVTCNNIPA